ncbi:MAG TPA: cation-translocating P-type ATPase [Limnobacter sp.]|uniref:heavy metal translocating P-type ATPase n=1 Tax=Limnobacter sp. TaxID=2003368 RepID=UPI002E2F52BE|nr:cation-translocating P-type ATPase [Limnobacter sp.]HEX5486582.1 cation-translocating P-type ATPase [Limnobacter sp.]
MIQSRRTTHSASDSKLLLYVPAMDCANEEREIRQLLKGVIAESALHFHLSNRQIEVQVDPRQIDEIIQPIRKAGFEVQLIQAREDSEALLGRQSRLEALRASVALVFALTAEFIHVLTFDDGPFQYVGMLFALMGILLAGGSTYRKGLMAIRQLRMNISALMSVAVTGAFLIGQWPEAAMVMALYACAEWIEARSVARAKNAVYALLKLRPERVHMQQCCGGWNEVSVDQVPRDSLIRIRPGARVPLDGVIESGQSTLDESSLTGESMPVDKHPGSVVYAGTLNQSAELTVRVTATSTEGVLSQVIAAVEQAQQSRAPTQGLVDRFARWYTPLVFFIALGVAFAGPLLWHLSWLGASYKAFVLLVIACPCALVISTPVTIVSGLARAARMGVVIKGGAWLEAARDIAVLAIDKTGTLTVGRPLLAEAEFLDSVQDEAMVRALAIAMAERSDHPVAKAIAQGLQPEGEPVDLPVLQDYSAVAGVGVQAHWNDQFCQLGNRRLLDSVQCPQARVQLGQRLNDMEAGGRSTSVLMCNDHVLALFAVSDEIRPGAAAQIRRLKGLGVKVVMLTGDNPVVAQGVGRSLGIEDIRASLLPNDKMEQIRHLRAESAGLVAMAGDGINDAPALASAGLGFALGGSGTDIAMDTADIVVMNDNLARIVDTIELSKKTRRVLWQNIGLALGIKLVFLYLAVFQEATMWEAVFADMGASLLVVFNGLRLLR